MMTLDVAISPRGTAHAMEPRTTLGGRAYWMAVCGRYTCGYDDLAPASGPAPPSRPCRHCLHRRRKRQAIERNYLGPYGLWEDGA